MPGFQRAQEERAQATVDPLQLAFLCLRLPVTLAVKAQLVTFSSVVASDPERAATVRGSALHSHAPLFTPAAP